MTTDHRDKDQPSILIIDDSPENIDVLKQTLKSEYIVRPALDGTLGLRIALANPQPDLILLDVMMPGLDGFEVLRRLRDDERTRDIPVLFVTAVSDVAGELRGLEMGAVDYITKPFNPAAVKARVRTHLALRAAQMRIREQNAALIYERDLIEGTIERMRQAPEFDSRELRCLLSPLDRSNGDIVLSASLGRGAQRVMVADITGHGLPASVAAPLVSYVFYSMASEGKSAAATLAEINRVMYRQLPADLFMTACMVDIGTFRESMCIWNAGMPPALLMKDGKVIERIGASRMLPLGVAGTLDLEANVVSLSIDNPAQLYLSSDGIIDAENASGEPFGSERLEQFLAGWQGSGRPISDLLEHLREFCDGDFDDDISLVEVNL